MRRALVIGNDKYLNVSPLLNAREDASAIASTLTQLGYAVSLHRDVDEKKFKQALRDFRGTLAGGEEVLFFFAGHGVQLGAANYLLPVDINASNEEQVRDDALALQRLHRRILWIASVWIALTCLAAALRLWQLR